MRIARERLIFHAICVVDEAIDRAHSSSIQPYPALRLALAYLHLSGAKRNTIDNLWTALRGEPMSLGLANQFGRRQAITAA